MTKDFIPLGFGQYLFTKDSSLDFLDPSFEEANLLRTSQAHHVNNISIAPISQDETHPLDHMGVTNVPLLDILLPQEGTLPIVQHGQFNPTPPLDVSQAIKPPMDLLLPIEDPT